MGRTPKETILTSMDAYFDFAGDHYKNLEKLMSLRDDLADLEDSIRICKADISKCHKQAHTFFKEIQKQGQRLATATTLKEKSKIKTMIRSLKTAFRNELKTIQEDKEMIKGFTEDIKLVNAKIAEIDEETEIHALGEYLNRIKEECKKYQKLLDKEAKLRAVSELKQNAETTTPADAETQTEIESENA